MSAKASCGDKVAVVVPFVAVTVNILLFKPCGEVVVTLSPTLIVPTLVSKTMFIVSGKGENGPVIAPLTKAVAAVAGYIFSPGNVTGAAPTTGSIKANTSLDDGCFKTLTAYPERLPAVNT